MENFDILIEIYRSLVQWLGVDQETSWILSELRYWLLPINAWWLNQMETVSALLAFCAGNSPITVTKASGAELWCFLWSAPEPTVEQTMETLVIWDATEVIFFSNQIRILLLWTIFFIFELLRKSVCSIEYTFISMYLKFSKYAKYCLSLNQRERYDALHLINDHWRWRMT